MSSSSAPSPRSTCSLDTNEGATGAIVVQREFQHLHMDFGYVFGPNLDWDVQRLEQANLSLVFHLKGLMYHAFQLKARLLIHYFCNRQEAFLNFWDDGCRLFGLLLTFFITFPLTFALGRRPCHHGSTFSDLLVRTRFSRSEGCSQCAR
eukprot:1194758-Prorocentrum_minimum.AAC.1